MDSIVERRKGIRVATEQDLHCFIAGKPVTVRMANLSTAGAQLIASDIMARTGDIVLLKIEGVTSLVGHVIWQKGELVGFEFNTPLHPAVVSYLGFEKHGVEKPDTVAEEPA
ncbi:PilZ domain-containing protein [Parerythrobacter aestuarii]|uniref:PilZ domain-containing protein n=1 Tax=Parerythrobacter aestuarii TaxID=3020909 RepID=UPI0024DE7140|nr:PilZ domain-containing protein [Parerythrobacter aestuarii]